MNEHARTNPELIEELSVLKQRIQELEHSESDRKQSEEALIISETRFRAIINVSPVPMALNDEQQNIIFLNPAFVQTFGYTREDIPSLAHWWPNAYPDLEYRQWVADTWQAELEHAKRTGAAFSPMELTVRCKNGTSKTVLASAASISKSFEGNHLVVLYDITERNQSEEALRQSEEKYRGIFESIMDVFYRTDNEGLLLIVSPSIERLLGYIPDEVIGKKKLIESYINPEERDQFLSILREKGEVKEFEAPLRAKDGAVVWVSTNAQFYRDKYGKTLGVQGISRDITNRKQAEKALTRTEEKFRKAFYTSPDSVNINRLEDGKYISINPGFTRITGYTEEDIIGNTSIEYNIWENIKDRQRLVAGLIKDGEVTNLEAAFRMKGGDIRYGLMSATVIDLNGVPHILSITRDITTRKRAEEGLQRTLESLRRAVGTTIQVMVSAVEIRDPYTAGHQIRSAGLARAIATEMGLPQDKIDGIRMAGSIHDIGKLSIPAEILSKPTKLTDIEFSLIKEHARSRYEILKDVESPWPLAEIVYQHHERIDGSGYPRNLKGDDILMEARIMAVADVVEAMASHRPYRPGLGIDAALEEIEKNRGTFYDNAVADACLRLFREKGFNLEGIAYNR
ncbi:MAG: PAS domain S-box protein [Deltaproteobacteria bacterium]|nr:PAS domain S-box protein [Deltaproteobacteria bacterium]